VLGGTPDNNIFQHKKTSKTKLIQLTETDKKNKSALTSTAVRIKSIPDISVWTGFP
jgi:hypothetical protein